MLRIKRGEELPAPSIIPTPSFGLNMVLGGGIWTGRITTLWGNPQCGKTTLALHTMANAQKEGYIPVVIDAEGSYTESWGRLCGINTIDKEYLQSCIVEEILTEIIPMMKSKEKYIFLLDSINGIIFENFNKADDGGQQMGMYARTQKYLNMKIGSYIHPNMAVIYVAQQSTGFTTQNKAFLKGNLSHSTEHWSTNIIKLFASGAQESLVKDDDTDLITSQQVTWTIEKGRQSACTGTKGHYWFHPQSAYIDQKKEIIHLGVRSGVIEKAGSWYKIDGEKYQGLPNFLEAVTDEQLDRIKNALTVDDLEIAHPKVELSFDD